MRLSRLFRREPPPRAAATLYAAVVARGRLPHWYVEGQVPDTIDGRFDMIAAVLAMAMLRLEQEGAGAAPAASLAECFVDDMDGQLRQIGFGDMVVGKHIGRMMAMLGGRIGAYRDGLAENTLEAALVRNLYRGTDPGAAPLAHVAGELRALHAALVPLSVDALVAGEFPE
jgi:cytochrome b pre-mRNA-processing protein 3